MRLQKFYLPNYGVLQDLTIHFSSALQEETQYTLDLLVGVNGTGKSTVLRAIVETFYNLLIIGDNSPYPFEMMYTLQSGKEQQFVRIINRLEGTGMQVWLNDEEQQGFSSRLLPEKIFIFTTGNEDEWERIFVPSRLPGISEGNNLEELPPFQISGRRVMQPEEGEIEHDRQFIFIRTEYLSLLTLCGLLINIISHKESKNRILQDVLEKAKLGELKGFSLKFFTANLKGKQKTYLQKLSSKAVRSLHLSTNELLLVFDLETQGDALIDELFEDRGGLALFEELMLLMSPYSNPPILKQVNLFLERSSPSNASEGTQPLHLLEWLSDGERSFLARMCLFALLGNSQALVLLDEPEVHFNDYWKREIVHLIDRMIHNCPSHIVITTHSGITLTDVPSENILLLKRNANYTTSEAVPPSIPTLAADPNEIITGIFDAPQATGAQGIIRVKREIINALALSDSEKKEALEQLRQKVGFGYWHYLILRELKEI